MKHKTKKNHRKRKRKNKHKRTLNSNSIRTFITIKYIMTIIHTKRTAELLETSCIARKVVKALIYQTTVSQTDLLSPTGKPLEE